MVQTNFLKGDYMWMPGLLVVNLGAAVSVLFVASLIAVTRLVG